LNHKHAPQILIETSRATVSSEGKKFLIAGNMLVGDTVNKNSRRYSSAVLSKAVNEIKPLVQCGAMFGTLGHCESADPMKVSHVIKSLNKRGSNYYGVAQCLDEGAGKVLQSIIRAGGQLGFSRKGTGTIVEENGVQEVQDDYRILSLDCVLDPSNGRDTALRVIQESTEAAKSLGSPTGYSIVMNLLQQLEDKYPGIAAASKNIIDFDKDIMPYTDPNTKETWLQIAERDRANIIQKLAALQLALQDYGNIGKQTFSSYAQLIAQTSCPIKKQVYQREAAKEIHGHRLIKDTCNLLQRIGKNNHSLNHPPK